MRGWFIGLGSKCISAVEGSGGLTILFAKTLSWLFRSWPSRSIVFRQMYQVGNQSLPVVLTTGVFTGMVLAVQSYYQFVKLDVESLVGAIVGMSMVKELGPVLTGIMMAGRVGAAMTAELGTMKVTEQIDALETLATDPVRYLVLPRFIACFLLTPLLTVLADFIGMAGGYAISVCLYGIDPYYYVKHTRLNIVPWDIMTGVIKGFVFGAIIAMVACYKGFTTEEGAEGVGKATTECVVAACITILISDFFLTVLMG